MDRRNISISQFKEEVEKVPLRCWQLDINTLLGVCGASPISVRYVADQVVVHDVYPEEIVATCGKSYVFINQIQTIKKNIDADGIASYEIICGILHQFRQTIKITES